MGEARGQQEVFIKLCHTVLNQKPKPTQLGGEWVGLGYPIMRHTL